MPYHLLFLSHPLSSPLHPPFKASPFLFLKPLCPLHPSLPNLLLSSHTLKVVFLPLTSQPTPCLNHNNQVSPYLFMKLLCPLHPSLPNLLLSSHSLKVVFLLLTSQPTTSVNPINQVLATKNALASAPPSSPRTASTRLRYMRLLCWCRHALPSASRALSQRSHRLVSFCQQVAALNEHVRRARWRRPPAARPLALQPLLKLKPYPLLKLKP
jgi:hypothetical protein